MLTPLKKAKAKLERIVTSVCTIEGLQKEQQVLIFELQTHLATDAKTVLQAKLLKQCFTASETVSLLDTLSHTLSLDNCEVYSSRAACMVETGQEMETETNILLKEIFGENTIKFPQALSAPEFATPEVGLGDVFSPIAFQASFQPPGIPVPGAPRPFATKVFDALGIFFKVLLLAMVDMIKFCSDILLLMTSIAAVASMKLVPNLDVSVSAKMKNVFEGLDLTGIGLCFRWILNIIDDIVGEIGFALNAGSRSSCQVALLFFAITTIIATILVTLQVVGGDFLGLLVGGKQKVLTYINDKKRAGKSAHLVRALPHLFKFLQGGVFFLLQALLIMASSNTFYLWSAFGDGKGIFASDRVQTGFRPIYPPHAQSSPCDIVEFVLKDILQENTCRSPLRWGH